MLDHAIVGIDHAPTTDRLIAELQDLARLGVTRLTLLTVLGGHYPQAPQERHREHYQRRLEAMAAELSRAEVAVEVRSGDPAAELRETAAESDADLIVVGSHGHTPWRDLFLGSTVLELLRTSAIPVLLLPLHTGATERGGGVLLATDGSDSAVPAEVLAGTLARSLGGVATTVVPSQASGEDVVAAREHLDRALDGALQPRVERGPVPETIGLVAEEQRADLIVTGARGRNPLTGLLLGSTAEHVLRASRRPVLLVPAGR